MYTVVLSTRATRELRKLEKDAQQKIATTLDLLSEEPRPPKAVALKKEKRVYRVRVGNYRILYEVVENELIVWVIRVAHRKNVYKRMMTTLTTVELRANLADVLGRVRHGHERIVITKSGKPVAGLIPYDELEAIEALEDQLDREALSEARADGGRHLLKEVKKELGLD